MRGGRISRGWALAKQSWSVLRADRSLLLFPLISVPATLAAAAIVMGPGVALYVSAGHKEPILIAFAVVTLYVLTFVALFFNTALAAAASKSLSGDDASLGDGLSAARTRLGAIAAWAGVQTVVGIVISAIQNALNDSIAGQILGGLLNFAWGAATFFVVPVLALEGATPKHAFTRSVSLLRERWGEGVVGTVSITGVVFLIAMLPAIALLVGGIALVGTSPIPGGVLIGVAVVLWLGAALVGGTLQAIFRVALYRYATADQVLGGFAADELQGAFGPKRRRR